MKKLLTILFVFVLMISYAFASSENLQFSVHWIINNVKTITMQVLPYSGSGSLPQDEHNNYLKTLEPLINSTPYNVCLIKYTTNIKGTHKLEFSATPMESELTSEEHPYSLYITYGSGFPVILDVDPEEVENSKAITFSVIGSGETTANIYLDAVLTDLDEMLEGDYSSTVTIMRVSE